jgi:hypothetical protein
MTDIDTTKVAKTRARTLKTAASMAPAAPPPAPAPKAAAAPTKSDTVIKLLLRAKGATPVELIAATDWQPHSVRAFLSGLRKKGRAIVREPRKNGDAAYCIVVAEAAETPLAAEPSAAAEPGTADLPAAAGTDA